MFIFDYHWLSLMSLIIIDYHWLSLIFLIIVYYYRDNCITRISHQLTAWDIIDYHWLSLIIIDYHWLSLIIIDYLKIWKNMTDSLTQWVADNLKSRDASASKNASHWSSKKYWGPLVDLKDFVGFWCLAVQRISKNNLYLYLYLQKLSCVVNCCQQWQFWNMRL